MSLQRVTRRLAEVCGHLNVLNAELVDLVGESMMLQGWDASNSTAAQWVAWQTGVSPERAHQIVQVVGRRDELPITFAAFTDGRLSFEQMATVSKRTPAHNDGEACQLAVNATVAQLRVGLPRRFFPPAPKPDTPESAAPQRQLSTGFNDDGDFFLHGLADGADGAVIQQALQEAKDALFRAGNLDATWLDALVEISKRSLDSVDSVSRRENFKIVIHLDAEGSWIHHGPTLPDALFERVTCDGLVQPLWHRDGSPINMGRLRHIVPLRTRIVVEDRDRICRHTHCTTSFGLQVHHIIHWANGGRTDTDNLCCLCPRHHRAHHNGDFTITGNPNMIDGLTFTDRNGTRIESCGQPTPPGNQPPPQPAKPYLHPTGEHLHTKWIYFTPPPPEPPSSTSRPEPPSNN